MKRLLSFVLCLCMVVLAFGGSVVAVESEETPVLSTDKTEYFPGEPIMVTAQGSGTDWVGIAPKGKVNSGGVRWRYIGEGTSTDTTQNGYGSGVAFDIREAYQAKTDGADIPAGEWTVFFVPNNGAARNYTESVDITVAPMFMEKTELYEGEEINLRATYTDAKDWVGILPLKDGVGYNAHGTLVWTYVTSMGEAGTVFDIRTVTNYFGDDKKKDFATRYGVTVDQVWYTKSTTEPELRLPAGEYLMVYVPQNGGVSARTYEIPFTVKDAVTVNKTEFAYGEPILVTPYGSGKDWVGIAPASDTLTENASIRWRYIEQGAHTTASKNGLGSGVTFDIRSNAYWASEKYPGLGDFPPGKYTVYIALDDQYAEGALRCSTIDITVKGELPTAPTSATYSLDSTKTGLAGGDVTVTFPQEAMDDVAGAPTHVILYWANEAGKLEDYTYIGVRPVTGTTTVIEMAEKSMIPDEATRLLVYAYNAEGVSEGCIAIDLPADRGALAEGTLLSSFQIVSDLHIRVASVGSIHNTHFNQMLADIQQIDPNTQGIFVAGDAADTGLAAEFEELRALWEASGLSVPLYLSIGNHEFKEGSTSGYSAEYATKVENFITYANAYLEDEDQMTDKQYYDVWVGGIHYIFLGSEYAGTHAYLSDAQLAFLDAALAEDRDASRPTFILLHQPMYNTIAGGMPGQGWNGVIAGDSNYQAWVAAGKPGLKDTYEAPLREILAKYPEAMMFSGHSHWNMTSESNMHVANDTLPNHLFNTASVGYLWNDTRVTTGEYEEGSQGYYVRVYDTYVELWGRDFANGKWIPNAMYRVELTPEAFEALGTVNSGVTLGGYALSTGGAIGFDVYLALDETVTADANAAVEFRYENGETVRVKVSDARQRLIGDTLFHQFTCLADAAELSDTVTIALVANGADVVTYERTVRDAAEYILENKAAHSESAQLAEALLKYGAAAQVFFGHNTDDLADKNLTDKTVATVEIDTSHKAVKTGSEEGISYVGSALLMQNTPKVRHFFTLTGDMAIGDYTFTVDGESYTPVADGGQYYIEVELDYADPEARHTLTVGGYSLNYGMMSYFRAVLRRPEQFEASLVTMLRALTLYTESIK
ncbi:MAG: metallophosphoesterase [Clostridia bacterium]|nr:metallophosphoesterase [Clostridia bacterium]